ncbi:MAG: hypothetical protein CMJ64_07645 [Planctomycetaceae bacterium]|nr:hypothetical protein [Planctomycetaceae bacterium]
MIGKSIRLAIMFAAAIAIPYAWFNPQVANTVQAKWSDLQSSFGSVGQSGDTVSAYDGSTFTPQTSIPTASDASGPALTGEVHRLNEILRFDVSPRWVMQHWGRVSTILSESDLEGLRVPLVTGTDVTSVTGSLTYYFDKQQQVRRITLHGHTGDDSQLVDIVTKQFKLRAESALGAGMYVSKWNGKPTSVLRVSHAPVVRANSPHASLQIALEINQPRAGFGSSAAAQEMLNHDQLTNRW